MKNSFDWLRSPKFWIGASLGMAYLVLHKKTYSYGGPDFKGLSRDPHLLVPAFADQLEKLFKNLREIGFDPQLNEGYRSLARAKALSTTGAGIADSLHIYGGAADIISASKGWDDPTFFKALGREAKTLGLTWGGDWAKQDLSHVQAVPVLLQDQFRALASNQRQQVLTAQYSNYA